jgi:hypothetical protein
MIRWKRLKFLTYLVIIATVIIFWKNVKGSFLPPTISPNYTHTTIYVDRRFSEEQMILICWAALRWTNATNHLVEFDVVRLPTEEHILTTDIIINPTFPDMPDIAMLDHDNDDTTLGYYSNLDFVRNIALVVERMDTNAEFEQVVMHELGHSVGLKHNKGADGMGTLMYPSVDLGSNFISKIDIINFCHRYQCDPSQLKDEELSNP